MTYNADLIRGMVQPANSAARAHHRKNQFAYAPRVKLSDLDDGDYRLRTAPTSEKNPHGFLAIRYHRVPKDYLPDNYLEAGVKFDAVMMQCPRSSNWEPEMPHTPRDEYGYPLFQNRCLCCELDEYAAQCDVDDDGEPIPGTSYMDQINLPTHLRNILGVMHPESCYMSRLKIPVILMAHVTGNNPRESGGKTYDNHVYGPHPSQYMQVELWCDLPPNQTLGQLLAYMSQDQSCGDPVLGRWFTLSKRNGGAGNGGYVLTPDLNPSPLPVGLDINHKKWGNYIDAGKKTMKKPSQRFDFNAQLAILENTAWAQEMKQARIPFTDQEAAQFEREAMAMGGYNPEDIPF